MDGMGRRATSRSPQAVLEVDFDDAPEPRSRTQAFFANATQWFKHNSPPNSEKGDSESFANDDDLHISLGDDGSLSIRSSSVVAMDRQKSAARRFSRLDLSIDKSDAQPPPSDFAAKMRRRSSRRMSKRDCSPGGSSVGLSEDQTSITSSDANRRDLYINRLEMLSVTRSRSVNYNSEPMAEVGSKCGMCGSCGGMPPWAPEVRSSDKEAKDEHSKNKLNSPGSVRFALPNDCKANARPSDAKPAEVLDQSKMSTKSLLRSLSRIQKDKAIESRRQASGEASPRPQNDPQKAGLFTPYRRLGSSASDASDGAVSEKSVFLLSYDGEEAAFRCGGCVRKFDRIKELEDECMALGAALQARQTMNRELLKRTKTRGKKATTLNALRAEYESLEMTVTYLQETLRGNS